jgi:predicted dienelactone hydrolase
MLDEGDFVAGHVADAPVVAIGHSFGGYTMLALAGAGYDLATLGPQCTADPSRSEFCSNWSPEAEAIFAQGFRDTRINTVIEMGTGDYSLFGAAGVAQVAVPVLHQTGSLDEHTPVDGEAYWQVLQGGLHRRLQIEVATHATFTDFSGFYDATVEGRMDVALGFDIINAYSYAWVLRAEADDFSTALGAEAPFLDGSTQTWAEAQILK